MGPYHDTRYVEHSTVMKTSSPRPLLKVVCLKEPKKVTRAVPVYFLYGTSGGKASAEETGASGIQMKT
jgi:hypothetical protein